MELIIPLFHFSFVPQFIYLRFLSLPCRQIQWNCKHCSRGVDRRLQSHHDKRDSATNRSDNRSGSPRCPFEISTDAGQFTCRHWTHQLLRVQRNGLREVDVGCHVDQVLGIDRNRIHGRTTDDREESSDFTGGTNENYESTDVSDHLFIIKLEECLIRLVIYLDLEWSAGF